MDKLEIDRVKGAKKPCICVLDDDDAVRNALAELFANGGFDTQLFADINSLLLILESQQPHCLIIDWHISKHSPTEQAPSQHPGTHLLAQIRNHCPESAIIILTKASDISDATAALKNGADDYITKPYVDRVLLEKVMVALG